MKILFIGDIVGSPGREAIKKLVGHLRQDLKIDFVIANAENAAGGSGITAKVAEELFASGVDVLTSGDHIWKKSEIFELINQEERILRPINFPSGAPGRGAKVFKAKNGVKVGVINVNGRVFMEALECPFRAALGACEELAAETKIIIIDSIIPIPVGEPTNTIKPDNGLGATVCGTVVVVVVVGVVVVVVVVG